MSGNLRRILIAVTLFVALIPVKLEMECAYSFGSGSCSEAGHSLIGLPIPSWILSAAGGLLFLVLILAPVRLHRLPPGPRRAAEATGVITMSVREPSRTRRKWMSWLWGVLAALLTPFVITGIFRILPETPFWIWWFLPFFAFSALAAALWFVTIVPRSVSVGIIIGTIAWAVFLVWLISQWGSARID